MTDFTQFKVIKKEAAAKKAVFEIAPLYPGFGYTLGNSLRRTLLSALAGWAVTQIKVKGAKHLFASLNGVKEDVLGIVLNVKQIRLIAKKNAAFTMELEKKGPGVVYAGDIKVPAGVKIVNPKLELAHLADKKTQLKIKFTVERGVGYSLAKEHQTNKMGVIAVDALYSPVEKVGYRVMAARVGKKSNYDRLLLEIETDGTIKPAAALKEAANILVVAFQEVAKGPRTAKEEVAKTVKKGKGRKETKIVSLADSELPTRLKKILEKAGFKKLTDFQKVKQADLEKISGLGPKSTALLLKYLAKNGIKVA